MITVDIRSEIHEIVSSMSPLDGLEQDHIHFEKSDPHMKQFIDKMLRLST